ncbi:hypothetical protein K470DRAFT_282307 [Piedraia hortae CBS 480.64]|uniref:Micro-fibrillar-associated protein 1 C-terminal domain-containing protein n=1 Tax=Piedraia hortae CBS 480.64 TaxID=1314780 RepID=A0A6A7BX52_9PEZI|nr:hypothetical protein K470DRAFT_282307 [Piedraia hortae CBS 480.64]
MTKQIERNTRYRPGKALAEDEVTDDEEEEEEEEVKEPTPLPPPKVTSFPAVTKGVVVKPAVEENDLDGFVTASSSEEEEEEEEREGSSEEEEEEGEEGEEGEESSDEDEEEEEQKKFFKPVFMSKAQRAALQKPTVSSVEKEEEPPKAEKIDHMLQETLNREAAARAARRKEWDDVDVAEDDVDDRDGIDPEAECAAWELRELKRVRRERLAIEEKEKLREEVERRKNMTAEEREEEDRAFLKAQQMEKDIKGRMAFLQKYHHKGAFYHDVEDEEVKEVLNRDFAGAKFEDEVADKSILPEYMKIRDMAKLGRKSRSKYKDMRSEDTGKWGADVVRKRRDADDADLDDRFRPDAVREQTGANALPIGEKRRGADDARSVKKMRVD